MVEPAARIRLYEPSDNRLARFMVGKANMEALAVANRRSYVHPLTLSLWVATSCIFTQVMHWWPTGEYGLFGYLRPLPAFGSMAFAMMYLIDWINRPFFEDRTQDALRKPDLIDIKSYYSRSPSSGFWILDHGDTFVGLLAIDSSLDSASEKTVNLSEKLVFKKGTASTATIRHFHVEEQYRKIGIQDDLLAHALRHTFQSNAAVKKIRAPDSPLASYTRNSLRAAGFRLQKSGEKVGIYRWKLGTRLLERATWEKANSRGSDFE